jgi:hypothetical protein
MTENDLDPAIGILCAMRCVMLLGLLFWAGCLALILL